MLTSIPAKRLLIYFLCAGLVPIALAWVLFTSSLDQTSALESHIWRLQDQALTLERKQSINIAIRSHFHEADHFYIDKNLETLTLLEPETESLRSMLNNPNYPDDEAIKKRLEALTGPANSLAFSEGIVQSTPIFQEVTETLAHPVEVDAADIQKLLCRIEGIPMGGCTPPPNRPQLIILDFKIEKKNVTEKNEVYSLNLKLLKREFL